LNATQFSKAAFNVTHPIEKGSRIPFKRWKLEPTWMEAGGRHRPPRAKYKKNKLLSLLHHPQRLKLLPPKCRKPKDNNIFSLFSVFDFDSSSCCGVLLIDEKDEVTIDRLSPGR
jgi:hypothetical protein